MEKSDGRKSFLKMPDEEWRNLWNLVQLIIHQKYGELPKKIGEADLEAEILAALEDAFWGRQRDPVVADEANEITFYMLICRIVDHKISHLKKEEKVLTLITGEKKEKHG